VSRCLKGDGGRESRAGAWGLDWRGWWSRLARSSVFAVTAAIVVLIVAAVGFRLSLVGPLLVHEGVRYWQAGTCRTDMRDGCRARVPAVVTSVDTSDGFCSVSLQAGDGAFTTDLGQCPTGGFERGAGVTLEVWEGTVTMITPADGSRPLATTSQPPSIPLTVAVGLSAIWLMGVTGLVLFAVSVPAPGR
jgi:hypothetical protein